MLIPILRNNVHVAAFKATESTMFTHVLMGAHNITAAFKAPKILPIQIGDYIEYKGEQFTINTIPSCKKNNNYDYDYQITFEGIRYKLYDKILMNSFGMSDFTYYGTAADLLELIVINMNQIDSGWSMGVVDVTEPQHVPIVAGTSCMVALGNFAQQFKLEWLTQGKTLNLVRKAGQDTSLVFERGRGKGLYRLSRTAISDANVVTRVYGYGSTRNLPLDYRGGIGRLTFAERFIDKNVEIYGIKEGAYTDEEIYPRRLGIVTAVSAFSETSATFTIQDSSLDFDLSDQIIPNVEGLVSFKTGELAGSDFVITGYDHATKTITLRVKDDAGERLPNTTYQAAIGDTFIFLDIDMPQSYVDAAEAELKTRTEEYSNENGSPRVAYDLEINLITMRDWNAQLSPGDRVTVKDPDLGVDQLIRTTEISHSVTFPDLLSHETQYNVTISDEIQYTIQERIKMGIVQNKREIKVMTRATQQVKAEIDNARSTLANVRSKTDFLKTQIDGNVVATGTMIVGDAAGNNNAGVSGVVDPEHFPIPGENIRFWAGATYENRGIAPWRVLQNGKTYMTDAYITGVINALSGIIGGFDINSNSLVRSTSPTKDSFQIGTTYQYLGDYFLVRRNSNTERGRTKEFSTNLNGIGSGNYAVLIKNNIDALVAVDDDDVIALRLEAAAGTWGNNIALHITSGRIKIGDEFGMNGTLNISVAEGTYPGAVGRPPITIAPGDSDNVLFMVRNGLIMGNIGRP